MPLASIDSRSSNTNIFLRISSTSFRVLFADLRENLVAQRVSS